MRKLSKRKELKRVFVLGKKIHEFLHEATAKQLMLEKFSDDRFVKCLSFLVDIYLFIYFISIFILLTRRKATEALILRVGNYPDLILLPEIPRYRCPLVI